MPLGSGLEPGCGMDLTFLGAAGTVTGSKYLLEAANKRILIDCGLFQGEKQLRQRNWERLPFEPSSIDAVVLTHAHLDHTGYLPLLVRDGFRGPVYCTAATRELTAILLADSGRIQEEDASFANRHGYSRHAPALPLYTEADAMSAMEHVRGVAFDADVEVVAGVRARFRPAGHILGAATVQIDADERSIVFSGDLGRSNDVVMRPPVPIASADYIVIESTYGDRLHDARDPQVELADVIRRTAHRGGIVAIPAFAVGRVQSLLYRIHLLKQSGAIPSLIPVFLDSPMATDVSRLYCDHHEEHRLDEHQCGAMCRVAKMVRTVDESKRLDAWKGPAILIAGSGMLTGGRILHHLKVLAPERRNTILLVGFQAHGTRGAALLGGARQLKIHGGIVPVHAEVAAMHNLSAHADAAELLDWLRPFRAPPRKLFVTHGEPAASQALVRSVGETLGWTCAVPGHLEKEVLS